MSSPSPNYGSNYVNDLYEGAVGDIWTTRLTPRKVYKEAKSDTELGLSLEEVGKDTFHLTISNVTSVSFNCGWSDGTCLTIEALYKSGKSMIKEPWVITGIQLNQEKSFSDPVTKSGLVVKVHGDPNSNTMYVDLTPNGVASFINKYTAELTKS